ncbi:MAG: undecaprenyldiphospho-muramoylpentapeptide beta-N-acetylglucosaminyltransferase [Cellulosilyticaceae bacterium]
MKRIVLTGGGTAGHVMVNLVLIPYLLQEGWQITYIGSLSGVERELLSKFPEVDYYGVSTGKLRRYFSWENFKDPLRLCKGIVEATKVIRSKRPSLLFSCGGFVSIPAIIGAWFCRVPIVLRETDYSPGLATRLALPFAKQVCVTFPDTLKELPLCKRRYDGPIIRPDLLAGDAAIGFALTGLSGAKPVLLFLGGSQGSLRINELVISALPALLECYDVIHIVGPNQPLLTEPPIGYKAYNYVGEDLAHLYALADLVITRAGSNALFEALSLHKPLLLLPLSKKVSRGDQILNAQYATSLGYAKMILEEDLGEALLLREINYLYKNRAHYLDRLLAFSHENALYRQLEVLKVWAKK